MVHLIRHLCCIQATWVWSPTVRTARYSRKTNKIGAVNYYTYGSKQWPSSIHTLQFLLSNIVCFPTLCVWTSFVGCNLMVMSICLLSLGPISLLLPTRTISCSLWEDEKLNEDPNCSNQCDFEPDYYLPRKQSNLLLKSLSWQRCMISLPKTRAIVLTKSKIYLTVLGQRTLEKYYATIANWCIKESFSICLLFKKVWIKY